MPDLKTYLGQLQDLSQRTRAQWDAADYSLELMRRLVGALGNPQQAYPSLHVAGSNGKGSVCALASAALQAQGYRVGLYTSPHLEGPLAGIQLDGEVAQPEALERAWAALYPRHGGLDGVTVFELVTALAFRIFADQAVDVAVIEVGLGGRQDATNVIVPTVSVITPIDLEHTHVLGDTLAQIAAEKGGIIKPGVPLVLAPQEAEAAKVLQGIAAERQAPLFQVGQDIRVERLAWDAEGQEVRISPAGDAPLDLHLNLLGAHQAINAATAFGALLQLDAAGTPVSMEAIRGGFAQVRWPARMELIRRDPPVLLDGAHTPAAARALAAALNDHFPDQPIVGLLGVSEDKRAGDVLQPLAARLAALYATQSGHPRALPAGDLQARLEGEQRVDGAGDLDTVLPRALQHARPEGALVLVFGSVFLAEEAREWLLSHPSE